MSGVLAPVAMEADHGAAADSADRLDAESLVEAGAVVESRA